MSALALAGALAAGAAFGGSALGTILARGWADRVLRGGTLRLERIRRVRGF